MKQNIRVWLMSISMCGLLWCCTGCATKYQALSADEANAYSLGVMGKGIKLHVKGVKLGSRRIKMQLVIYNYYSFPVVIPLEGIICHIQSKSAPALVSSRAALAERLLQLAPMEMIKPELSFAFDPVPPGTIELHVTRIFKGTMLSYQHDKRLPGMMLTLPARINPIHH